MLAVALLGLATAASLALLGWLASLWRRDASLADRIWPWLIVLPALVAAGLLPAGDTTRHAWTLGLVLAWALRLCLYISWRNWGHGEDRRYRAMRERHGPSFAFKSLYLVFGLQALLGWAVSMPALVALTGGRSLGLLDILGASLALMGLVIETVADAQMARFRKTARASDAVMDQGLWRYSRHPNYFGESCMWWGLGLMALGAGGAAAAWSLASPLLMTWLLLRVSGVSLLEQDLRERRPAYRDYIRRTSAFIPWPPAGPRTP